MLRPSLVALKVQYCKLHAISLFYVFLDEKKLRGIFSCCHVDGEIKVVYHSVGRVYMTY